mgnify:CR=1 FL=1
MDVMQNNSGTLGIIAGTLFSIAAGSVYIILLHEPGPCKNQICRVKAQTPPVGMR